MKQASSYLSAPMRVAFIVNPTAGSGGLGPKLVKQLPDWATEFGLEAQVFTTAYAGHAVELTRSLAADYEAIVAVGGDGTVREVGIGLLGTDALLGIVPIGSGNGLARHLGIPMRPRLAVAALPRLMQGRIDIGWANGDPFFMVFGAGFDADVAYRFAGQEGRGFGNYLKAGTAAFENRGSFGVEIDMDGQLYRRELLMLTAANASQFGNNAHIAPEASAADGRLNLTFVGNVGVLDAVEVIGGLFSRNLMRLPGVEKFAFCKATITTETAVPYHLDGEPMNRANRFELYIQPSALGVLHEASAL